MNKICNYPQLKAKKSTVADSWEDIVHNATSVSEKLVTKLNNPGKCDQDAKKASNGSARRTRTPIGSVPDFIPISTPAEESDAAEQLPNPVIPNFGPIKREQIRIWNGTPWMNNFPIFRESDKTFSFHNEILSFCDWILPTHEEKLMREIVFMRFRKIILDRYPVAQVECFGSFATGLYLPTSDIDIVVLGKWSGNELPLWTLKEDFLRSGIALESGIKVLDKATVPIIKVKDVETGITVDISFNQINGINTAFKIREFIQEFPRTKELVLIIKQFLVQRDLNEVFTGGISSYGLILLVVAFLRSYYYEYPHSYENENLGILLCSFFELYGHNFNWNEVGVTGRFDRPFMKKADLHHLSQGIMSYMCIEDPLQPDNDVGKSTFAALQIIQSFEFAYVQLKNCISASSVMSVVSANNNGGLAQTFLSKILCIPDALIQYRENIRARYSPLLLNSRVYGYYDQNKVPPGPGSYSRNSEEDNDHSQISDQSSEPNSRIEFNVESSDDDEDDESDSKNSRLSRFDSGKSQYGSWCSQNVNDLHYDPRCGSAPNDSALMNLDISHYPDGLANEYHGAPTDPHPAVDVRRSISLRNSDEIMPVYFGPPNNSRYKQINKNPKT